MGRGRRTINRVDQRPDAEEEQERAEDEEENEDEEDEGDNEEEASDDEEEEASSDEDEPVVAPKKPKKKATGTKRRSSKVVRLKAVWVVYDNSSKQVKDFPYNEKEAAEKLVEEKNADKKGAYYLQMVKVPLEE